jgi:hypothetical protein
MVFKFVQLKGQILFKGELITKMLKKMGSFKNLLKNHKARKIQIYMKTFSHRINFGLFFSNLGPRGSGGAITEKIIFTCVYIEKIFLKSLCQKCSNLHENVLT